jgi:HNH endonuclease
LKPLTLEHVLPRALGGRLVSRLLCKDCNSRLGHSLEGPARTDPTIRQLATRLRAEIPKLASQIEEGQAYTTIGPGAPSTGHIKKGSLVVRTTKLSDGSLTQSTPNAEKSIKGMLARDGLTERQIEAALKRFADAPENIKLALSPSIEVVKWSVTGMKPSFDGPLLNPLIPAKSAYEFLALHVGTAIYQDTPPLRSIRKSLHDGTLDTQHTEVERLHAPVAKAFHGLLFEGNQPYAKVVVRLFGQLAFRIHFKHLSVSGPRGMYTHELASNDEHMQRLAKNDA